MKKFLSVFLAFLMTLFCFVPAFAAPTNNYTLSFRQPSIAFEGGYQFVESVDGKIQFVEDPDGIFVFFDNRYMTMDNIFENSWDQVPPERYSPVVIPDSVDVAEGTTFSFQVITSSKYNLATVAVFINEERTYPNVKGEYTVYVDRDMTIKVGEYDENGSESLLRNHYNVKFPSGDGYNVLMRKGENYNVVYYGDSFYFRVRIVKGYSAPGIKVSVMRTKFKLGEADGVMEMIGSVLNKSEVLNSLGVDEDGCRLYKIDNITSDCSIVVSGVNKDSISGILSFLKRILKLILDFFGVKVDFLETITNHYSMKIINNAPGIAYQVFRANDNDDPAPTDFQVMGGDGISLVVTKKNVDQNIAVRWTPGNETGSYQTVWQIKYDPLLAETSYSAVYNIDNISANTTITIE